MTSLEGPLYRFTACSLAVEGTGQPFFHTPAVIMGHPSQHPGFIPCNEFHPVHSAQEPLLSKQVIVQYTYLQTVPIREE